VGDLLAGEQCADDVDALAEAGVAGGFVGPRVAGDVLVGELTGPERDGQAVGEHLGERPEPLRDDGRVVALTWGVDEPEGDRGGGERRAEPGHGEAGLPLPDAPRREVVGRPGGLEAGFLGVLHVGQ
jgi:hypothetical protein